MSNYDFKPLKERFPAVIDQMPPVFTAHEFILRFAQQNQTLYVEALYAYRNTLQGGSAVPFMMVHSQIASALGSFPDKLQQIDGVSSIDIFGNAVGCSRWQKVANK